MPPGFAASADVTVCTKSKMRKNRFLLKGAISKPITDLNSSCHWDLKNIKHYMSQTRININICNWKKSLLKKCQKTQKTCFFGGVELFLANNLSEIYFSGQFWHGGSDPTPRFALGFFSLEIWGPKAKTCTLVFWIWNPKYSMEVGPFWFFW